jgi:glycosyltransferase involved in cell wall biosynthesis
MHEPIKPETPGVSIIIPNYNYGRFIGEAIDSALAQTHPLVEVIVVDDGSTDNSRAVIESYGQRVTAIFQANAGQTKACEAGFDRSHHPIVIFLDADDRLVPEAAAIAATDWPEGCSKRQFRLQTLDRGGMLRDHYWPKYSRHLTPGEVRQELLRTGYYQCPPTTGNAFARDFLRQMRPFGPHPHIDALLNTLAPLYGDVVTDDEVVGHYRLHGSNHYSTDRVDASSFAKYRTYDRLRIEIMTEHCRKLDIPFAGQDVLRALLPFQELEVVVAKLEANRLGDQVTVLRCWLAALRAGIFYPQSLWHGLLRGLWISVVALAPKRLAVGVVAMRYVPTSRPSLLEGFINVFRRQRPALGNP